MSDQKTEAAAGSGYAGPDCSARDRILLLHEAICRCSTCKGTVDKSKLCRMCAEHDAEIGRLQNASMMVSE